MFLPKLSSRYKQFLPSRLVLDMDDWEYPDSNKLYIAVMDSSYSPQKYHCIMKKQWIDEAKNETLIIDGIEIYSLSHYKIRNCQFETISVPPPDSYRYDQSSYLLFNILKQFLQRTRAGWLFLIGDSAYLKFNTFLQYFSKFTLHHGGYTEYAASGSCFERRSYFQTFSISSGVLLSRRLIQDMVNLKDKWELYINLSYPADEALGMITSFFAYAPYGHLPQFLGRPWINSDHWDILMKHDYSQLNVCQIPYEVLHPIVAQNGICYKKFSILNQVTSWSAGNKMKEFFLGNAPNMLDELPDYVGFYWHKLYPSLCRIDNQTLLEELKSS